jgi:isopentenyl diphosphate isomerase/L-lactate dehydrogenase-like FMN-dependent dehydrogenase
MHIQDRTTRVDALTMWKQKFIKRVEPLNLPTIIKTHILSVATSRFRDLIIESKKPRQLTNGDVYNYYLNSESSRESKQRDIRAIIASQFIPNEQKHLIMWINERNNWDWIQKGEPNADNT